MVQKVRQLLCLCCLLGSALIWSQVPTIPIESQKVKSTYTFRYPLSPAPSFVISVPKSVLMLPSHQQFVSIDQSEFRWERPFLQNEKKSLLTPSRLTTDFTQPICGLPTQGASFNLTGKDVLLPCLADQLLQWAIQSIGR